MSTDLALLSFDELAKIYEAHGAAQEAALAVTMQPCVTARARDIIDALIDRSLNEMQRIAAHVAGRPANGVDERWAKGEILVRWKVTCGGWSDLVAVVRENFEALNAGGAA